MPTTLLMLAVWTMATPNYEQIQSFGHVTAQLQEAAIDEFLSELSDGMASEEVMEEAIRIAEKFSALGSELGAQWYDLCSELAGLDVEPAIVDAVDTDAIAAKANATMARAAQGGTLSEAFSYYLQNVINDSIRTTGDANLWRDYERGLAGGRWARVPVGDTCAWCLMLASQGAWYLSEDSALTKHGAKYHDGCNCVAVYHADADSIKGYSALERYKEMYYDVDNLRRANANPNKSYEYPQELKDRITAAKAAHKLKYDSGETDVKWTKYNEDLIVMRYKYGLK